MTLNFNSSILIEDVSSEERINFDSGVTTFNEGNNNIDFKVRGTSGTLINCR